MRFVKQFCVILFFSFVGELLHQWLPLPVPAALYGILLLFGALQSGLLPLAAVQRFLFQFGHLRAQGGNVRFGLLHGGLQFPDGRAVAGGLVLDAARAFAGAGQPGPGPRDLGAGVLVLVLQHGQAAVGAGGRFG